MKATCTTISGRTQCARKRGNPVAFVNGVVGISRASSRARRSSSSVVSKPVPTLPAKHEIAHLRSSRRAARPRPTRLPLRIGEAADDELLRRLALHLQPVLRATMLVLGVAPLGDDAFPPFAAGALPGLRIVERRHLSSGSRSGSCSSSARRSSSGRAVRSRPSSHRMSNTW